MRTRTKYLTTAFFAVLLILLYILIFTFSDQDSVQSSGISFYIAKKYTGFLDFLLGGKLKELFTVDPAIYFENPIRKLAHFMEYAFMASLLFMMLRPWMKISKKLFFLIVIWVFLSAAGDEIHQLYVPGRWGSFADVCLDTCGGMFGYCVCVLGSKILNKMKKRKEKAKVQIQNDTE